MDGSYRTELEMIGFLLSAKATKALDLLRVLLALQESGHPELVFADIYDAFTKQEDKPSSKAWVHRLLRSLVDMNLVGTSGMDGRRAKYLCNVNTIVAGIDHLKEQALQRIENERQAIEQRKELVISIDTHNLAQKLYQDLTGHVQLPSSRFLKDINEFHKITNETIYDKARKGDIIRTSVANAAAFVDGYTERLVRVFRVVERGVEIRYAVPPETLRISELFEDTAQKELVRRIIGAVVPFKNTGPGFHFRINPAGTKSHQFVSLNNEVVALWISESPPTAAWITRDFNADLIDDIIKTFDEQWEKSLLVSEVIDDKWIKEYLS